MSVSFNEIPGGIRVPFVYVEFDNSRAVQGPSLQEYRILLIGQKLASGTKNAEELHQITSASQADDYFGKGSMIARMASKSIANNNITGLFAVALDDDGAAAASAGTVTFTGPASGAGSVKLYVAGQTVAVGVADADSADDIAAALETAINADLDLPVTASAALAVVTLTAKNKGIAGDEIDVRFNYFAGDVFPEGVGGTIVALAGGATNPDVADALAALDDEQYNVICMAYSDAANIIAMDSELSGRFGPLDQRDGVAFYGKRESFANLVTLGNSSNSKHISAMGMSGPASPWEWAGAICGSLGLSGQIDPARPFQTLELSAILAPSASELFSLTERDQLLKNGISTYTSSSGVVRIERMITMYQENAFAAPDVSYLDVNTLFTLSYLRFDFRNTFLRKYPRHKLGGDNARIAPGQPILTPKAARAEAINIFKGWETLGLVEDIDQFKNDLIVERNTQDVNRLDILLPPNLINQLRVTAAQIQFLL